MKKSEKYNELRARINRHCPEKILGTPPTLEHVLRSAFHSNNSLNISQLGELYEIRGGERVYGHIYNLTKPLSDQSEETLDFLLDVIK